MSPENKDSQNLIFLDLDISNLNPKNVLRKLDVDDDGQLKNSKKTRRDIMQALNGIKKPKQIEYLFDRYSKDPFWLTVPKKKKI